MRQQRSVEFGLVLAGVMLWCASAITATAYDKSEVGRPFDRSHLVLPGVPPATPPPPSNGGQCVIDASGGGYNVHEVQRWEVNGPGTISGSVKLLPLRWSTSGGGSKSGQTSSSTWTIAAAQMTQLRIQKLPTGSWLVDRASSQIRVSNGLTITVTSAGAPKTSTGEAIEYLYPAMSAPPTATRIDQAMTFPIGGSDAYQRPSNAPGQVACEWHVAF
jgi:hypothetical protein